MSVLLFSAVESAAAQSVAEACRRGVAEAISPGIADEGMAPRHHRQLSRCPLCSVTVADAQRHVGRVAETGRYRHTPDAAQSPLRGAAVPDAQRHVSRVAETRGTSHICLPAR